MNMKLKRVKLGMTQLELKEKANVSLSSIIALERGNIDGVRVKTIKKIAKALNSTVQELFFDGE
ncbi:helix-turn-helix transcriptional regulator [Clostridium perfringens]|uniref:helix-turn-helix transcriptional regulator n=1 Tax=Clostridium perfringens TaxID=1502 RepID=UPI0018AC4462|nr:helix-turn-helix transcriptional regulator [Clostridium perfringens]EIF6297238.1 helix-turn-helix transcriptional regulator [Clostridium perfringens]ELC8426420.1 helix-turn-helix transcriptional regulator [Clostridium perfringens]MDB2070446.1 helix-turn-helix transcriptional regulator [Clostridium perfringens]MDM0495581.1 helix-turn-helix transcriptional regulator [Clostridium perfringens]MDM0871838.1 helix-turn-helix transcriptional regulator [Clostridium perfringens]